MLSRAPYPLLFACAMMISGCDHRPSESALYGTWVREPARADSLYYEFRTDGTLHVLDADGNPTYIKGKWYAGGPNIYLRFPSEILQGRQLVVWHIVDISSDEFRVTAWRDGEVFVYHRVQRNSPRASNQAVQPTPKAFASRLAPFRNEFGVFATPAAASGRSACSR
jgi:hypothetical protein